METEIVVTQEEIADDFLVENKDNMDIRHSFLEVIIALWKLGCFKVVSRDPLGEERMGWILTNKPFLSHTPEAQTAMAEAVEFVTQYLATKCIRVGTAAN
jgi:hypothetical protein